MSRLSNSIVILSLSEFWLAEAQPYEEIEPFLSLGHTSDLVALDTFYH